MLVGESHSLAPAIDNRLEFITYWEAMKRFFVGKSKNNNTNNIIIVFFLFFRFSVFRYRNIIKGRLVAGAVFRASAVKSKLIYEYYNIHFIIFMAVFLLRFLFAGSASAPLPFSPASSSRHSSLTLSALGLCPALPLPDLGWHRTPAQRTHFGGPIEMKHGLADSIHAKVNQSFIYYCV